MSELENDPEEIPMDEVLAEIRRILSEKAPDNEAAVESTVPAHKADQPTDDVTPIAEESPVSEPADCFILTPEMRCDLPAAFDSTPVTSENAAPKQPSDILNRIQQKAQGTISPDAIAWLEANLPRLIDEALSRHFSR